MTTTNQLPLNNIDGASLSQSFCDIDVNETPQDDEAFEVETGCDDDHLVLCNRRLDYEMRSRLPLFFFLRVPQSEDDIAKQEFTTR